MTINGKSSKFLTKLALVITILFNVERGMVADSYSTSFESGLSKPFIDGDHSVNATLGKPVAMRCIVHNLKNYKIAWYFNGALLTLNTIKIRDDKRYSIDRVNGGNEWKLQIDPVDASNEGEYSCRLTNGMYRSVFLSVGVPPTFVDKDAQVVVSVKENSNVTLSCDAQGSPQPLIYWYKDHELAGTGVEFTLDKVHRHAHLEYECVARNNIEPAPSRYFKLNVEYKPAINIMYHLRDHSHKNNKNRINHHKNNQKASHPHNNKNNNNKNKNKHYQIDAGDLQVVCHVNANPINEIEWFKNGVRLQIENQNNNNNPSSHHNPSTVSVVRRMSSLRGDRTIRLFTRRVSSRVTIHTNKLSPHKFVSKLRIRNYTQVVDTGVYMCAVNGLHDKEFTKSVYINDVEPMPIVNERHNLLQTQPHEKKYSFHHEGAEKFADLKIDESLVSESTYMNLLQQNQNQNEGRSNNMTTGNNNNNNNNNKSPAAARASENSLMNTANNKNNINSSNNKSVLNCLLVTISSYYFLHLIVPDQ